MTDKKKNGSDPSHEDDAFRVEVPDDLLEEAVEAVERRVSESKAEVEETIVEDEPPVDVDLEATNPEANADLENMSVEDMMAGGFLPEKVVSAFNEANSRVIEAQIAAKESREKAAALLSESDAFRKRVQREKTDSVKFANESLLKEFIQILDNLERALHHSDSKPDGGGGAAVREGVEITLRQFLHLLQKFGVTRVPTAKGTPFDPHMHEAVQQVDSSELPNNSIAAVLQAGFMLHERLLRPAMVAVARNAAMPAVEPDESETEAEAEAEAGATGETEEEKLERIRRAGAAAREARQKKREEREATRAGGAEPDAVGQVAQQETEEEKLERIRRAGAAAREARQKKREERGRDAAAVATDAADAAMSVVDETLSERDDDVPLMEVAAGFEADEDTLAEEPPDTGETEAERLERIRRVGAAAREARQQKRAERADAGTAAATAAPAPIPTLEESPEEKLERIRRAGAAAREARQKKKAERMEGGGGEQPAQASASPLPQPSFADEDLDDWESTVDAVRTDKQQGRR